MTTSMIKGNPLKLMLQFAFPLLLGNLLQQTYNIIDAAIVGQILGAKALASVGASSSIQFLVLGFCMGNCLDHSNLLYFSDMPVVHPKVYKNACIYSSPSK